MTDYSTTAVLKQRLGISDTNDDARFAQLITAASNAVDRWCKRSFGGFVGAIETRVYDVPGTMAGPLRVRRADYGAGGFTIGVPTGYTSYIDLDPLLSATQVATDEDGDGLFETVWAGTGTPPDYTLLPLNAAADGQPFRAIRTTQGGAHQFPVGTGRLQIAGTWGEAVTVPPIIQEATILTAIRWFKRKDAPFGITGDLALGVVKLSKMDPDVQRMLEDGGYVDAWFFA